MSASDDAFWASVNTSGPCWEWTGKLNRTGYGHRQSRTWSQLAHRRAWQMLVGPIPEGMHLDHLCRNTRCVNPDHLEPVTPRENYERGYHRQWARRPRPGRRKS